MTTVRFARFAWAGLVRLVTFASFAWARLIRLERCAWFAWTVLIWHIRQTFQEKLSLLRLISHTSQLDQSLLQKSGTHISLIIPASGQKKMCERASQILLYFAVFKKIIIIKKWENPFFCHFSVFVCFFTFIFKFLFVCMYIYFIFFIPVVFWLEKKSQR